LLCICRKNQIKSTIFKIKYDELTIIPLSHLFLKSEIKSVI